jgi:hypothetical protein
MKNKRNAGLFNMVVIAMLTASIARAQTAPKMVTDTPPGIAIPDRVDTRLGELKFFDGFPDKPTVEKIYDNLDFQRAAQAYLLALPALNMAGLREGLLKEGPLVAEVPPKTLGMIDDFCFKYVTDMGIVGPDKGEGGKYLLLPPGYNADVPEGYFIVRVPTYESILIWRNMPVKGDIKPAIVNLKKITRIYPLSQAADPPANNFVNVSDRDFSSVAEADYKVWELLNCVVQNEPVESLDPVTLGFFASIGIEKGNRVRQPDSFHASNRPGLSASEQTG